jgi:hypothetical protein
MYNPDSSVCYNRRPLGRRSTVENVNVFASRTALTVAECSTVQLFCAHGNQESRIAYQANLYRENNTHRVCTCTSNPECYTAPMFGNAHRLRPQRCPIKAHPPSWWIISAGSKDALRVQVHLL